SDGGRVSGTGGNPAASGRGLRPGRGGARSARLDAGRRGRDDLVSTPPGYRRAVVVDARPGTERRDPRPARAHADQVQGIDRGDADDLAGALLTSDGPKTLDRLRQRVLLADEPRDEAAPADRPPRLQAPECPQDLAPGEGQRLARDHVAEHHAPAR